jgi:hypothetical protein
MLERARCAAAHNVFAKQVSFLVVVGGYNAFIRDCHREFSMLWGKR